MTEEEIEERAYGLISGMVKENPVKFISMLLVQIGKECVKANATDNTFSVHADMPDGKRYKIEAKCKIKEVKS